MIARPSQAYSIDLKCCNHHDYYDYGSYYDCAWQQHSLALMEAQAPQGGQSGAANDGSQLLQHLGRAGPHQHIHIDYASCHAPAQRVFSQNHLHGIAVEHKYAMAATICSTCNIITRYMQIVAGCCNSYTLYRTNLVVINGTCRIGTMGMQACQMRSCMHCKCCLRHGRSKGATVSTYYHTGCRKTNIQAAGKTAQGMALISW